LFFVCFARSDVEPTTLKAFGRGINKLVIIFITCLFVGLISY